MRLCMESYVLHFLRAQHLSARTSLSCVWHQQHIAASHANSVTDSLLCAWPGLVNPKSVKTRYDTRITKEVLSPLRVAEHNHVGADPHYCSLTSNLQVTYATTQDVMFAKGCNTTLPCTCQPDSLAIHVETGHVFSKSSSQERYLHAEQTTLTVGPQLVSGTVNNYT